MHCIICRALCSEHTVILKRCLLPLQTCRCCGQSRPLLGSVVSRCEKAYTKAWTQRLQQYGMCSPGHCSSCGAYLSLSLHGFCLACRHKTWRNRRLCVCRHNRGCRTSCYCAIVPLDVPVKVVASISLTSEVDLLH